MSFGFVANDGLTPLGLRQAVAGLENPTSENLAVWIWHRLKPRLPLLTEGVVAATGTARCGYRG